MASRPSGSTDRSHETGGSKMRKQKELDVRMFNPEFIWVAGRIIEGPTWQIIGLYSLESVAIVRCIFDTDFVAELELDRDIPDDYRTIKKMYFPYKQRAET